MYTINKKLQLYLFIMIIAGSLISYFFFEVKLALFLNSLDPKTLYDPFFKFINNYTFYISPILLVLTVIFTIFSINDLKYKLYFITAGNYIAMGFVDAYGIIIGKSRPSILYSEGIHTIIPFTAGYDFSSIPSGYMTTYSATATATYFIFNRNKILGLILVFMNILISISALLNSHHFFSSLLISNYFGYIIGLTMFLIFSKENKLFNI